MRKGDWEMAVDERVLEMMRVNQEETQVERERKREEREGG